MLLGKPKKIFIVAGAGLSASAGIPTFRSENGDWNIGADTKTALELRCYMTRPRCRKVLFDWIHDADMGSRKPTKAHLALKKLADANMLEGIATQNIDSLEKKAGIPEDLIHQVHGSLDYVVCQRCGHSAPMEDVFGVLYDKNSKGAWENNDSIPFVDSKILHCLEWNAKKNKPCKGVLKPDIIFYGEDLRKDVFGAAMYDAMYCDELWCIGTSLQVAPVNDIPRMVLAYGKTVRVIGPGRTPIDHKENVVKYDNKADDVVPALVDSAIDGSLWPDEE